MQINQKALRAAQTKALIARTISDPKMWQEAHQDIRKAINYPWYRRKK